MKTGDIVMVSDFEDGIHDVGVKAEFVRRDSDGKYLCRSLNKRYSSKRIIKWNYCAPLSADEVNNDKGNREINE